MSMLEIRLGRRTITLWGHHAEQLVVLAMATAILLPCLVAAIWGW